MSSKVSLPSVSVSAEVSVKGVNLSAPKALTETEAGVVRVGVSATGVTDTARLRTALSLESTTVPATSSVAVALTFKVAEPPKLAGAFKARPASCELCNCADPPDRVTAPAAFCKVHPLGTSEIVTLKRSDPSVSLSLAVMAASIGMEAASSRAVTPLTFRVGVSATGATFTTAVTVAPVVEAEPLEEVATSVRPLMPA